MLKRTTFLPLLLLAACGGSAGTAALGLSGSPVGDGDAGGGSASASADPPAAPTPPPTPGDPPPPPPPDAGSDADAASAPEAGSEAGPDAAPEAGPDAGSDGSPDADAAPPPPRYGVSFDRATLEYLKAPYPVVGSTKATFEGWFYVRQPTDEGRFFEGWGVSCAYANSVAYGAMRGHINCLSAVNVPQPQNQVFSQQPCPLGSWFHLAFVLDAGVFTLYVDGKAQGTTVTDFGGVLPGPGGVYMKWGGSGGATNETMDGIADEVRLSPTADYLADFVPPQHLASPAFLLDEGAGTPTALDGSTASFVNGPSWVAVNR